MANELSGAGQPSVTFERSYQAPVEDLWRLWATKEGFASWWGPEGFRVDVHTFDLRVGGELFYEMIAAGADQIAYMRSAGMPLSHETRGTFVEIEPLKRLKIRHMIDFIPGLAPYKNDIEVRFFPEGEQVRMVVTIEAHRDPEWTQRAALGFESQLTKLPEALAQIRK